MYVNIYASLYNYVLHKSYFANMEPHVDWLYEKYSNFFLIKKQHMFMERFEKCRKKKTQGIFYNIDSFITIF